MLSSTYHADRLRHPNPPPGLRYGQIHRVYHLTDSEGCAAAIIAGTGHEAEISFLLTSIAVNGSEAVAVALGGRILSSDNGAAWTNQTFDPSTHLWAVAYGGGIWVAVGSDGKSYTSSDRVTWTEHLTGQVTLLSGVTYGEGLFVAVDSSERVWSSPDGATWTIRATYVGQGIYSVIYGGGQFVATGVNGFITTSPDGITWTEQASGLAEDLYSVAYASGKFVVVSGISLTTLYSTDGVTWQQTTIPSNDSTVYDVAGGNGIFVTITQESGEVWVSTDGITWTQQFPNVCPAVNMVDYYGGEGGCQFNISQQYLPGEGCSGVYGAWDYEAGTASDIVVNDGLLVEVGWFGDTSFIRTSENGICWFNQTANDPTITRLYGVAYGNGIYIAVGYPRTVLSSPDGSTWTLQPPLGDPEIVDVHRTSVNDVAFGLGFFVALVQWDDTVSVFKTEFYTSTDGVSWTLRQTVDHASVHQSIVDLYFDNGIFIALGGDNDLIYTSPDGIVWTQRTAPTSGQTFYGAAYGAGAWIVTMDAPQVGDQNYVLRSTDNGVTWLLVEVAEQMYSISYGNGVFVLSSDDGDRTFTSVDGLTWTQTNLPSGNGIVRYYKDCTFII